MIERLDNKELETIKGGGISWGILAGLVSGGIFLIGVVDGYLRPYKCRK